VIYELRTYTATPGNLDKLHARFRDHTRRIFERHGMRSIGYWVQTSPEEGKDDLIYIVSHESREQADRNWQSFRADPEWVKVKADSEVDGPLVAGIKSQYMEATDYSAIK
jgi:hypothetical protein